MKLNGNSAALEGSAVGGVKFSTSYGVGSLELGTGSLANFSLDLNKNNNNPFTYSAIKDPLKTAFSAKRETSQSKESSASVDLKNGEVTVGAKVGVLYGQVTANFTKAGEAVQSWGEAVKIMVENYYKDVTNKSN